MAKKNNNSKYFRDWTTKKLKGEACYLHHLINDGVCGYGTKDVIMLDSITDELGSRGYELRTQLEFSRF